MADMKGRSLAYSTNGSNAHRRALGIGAHHAERAGGDADVDAAGDHRLHRLAAAAGEQKLEVEVVLAENPGALAQGRRRAVPYLTLTDRDLELVRGRCGSGCEPPRDGGGETNAGSLDHGGLPRARRGRGTCGNLRPRHRPRKRSVVEHELAEEAAVKPERRAGISRQRR